MSAGRRTRHPAVVAVVGLVTMAVLFVLALNLERLPVVGGGRVYSAVFAESGGLRPGNEVRVAGVRVGKVTEVALDGASVRVSFRVEDAWVGDQSTASIRIKTLLGQKFLAIDPRGDERLDAGDTIPMERTTTPYDVTDALAGLSDTVGAIDTPQLEQSFQALSDTFRNTPASVRGTIDGLSRLSRVVSSRDDDLAELLSNTATLSGTLAERRDQIGLLITDGDRLLDELADRRDAVRQLLVGTRRLSVQLSGLVADNAARLRPALDDLDRVTRILQRHEDDLKASLKLVAPYYRLLASAMGNGPWVDAYVCGLFDDTGAPVLDSEAERDCTPGRDVAGAE